MTIKKTKSGKYHTTVYIGKRNGKRIYKSVTDVTKKGCMLKAAQLTNHNYINDPTVKEMVSNYIEVKEPVLSPATIREYTRILDNDLIPLYNTRLSNLDNYTLQSFISSMNVSPKTVANRVRLLLSAVKMFSDKKFNVTLPQRREPQRTVATEADIKLMLANARPELYKAILLGICSLRRGEICAARYEDLHGNNLYVHADIIHDKYGMWVYKDHAKTPESTRTVFIPTAIVKQLGTGTGFIVGINPNSLTQAFCRLRDRLGINISLHSLRRFYASICHYLGLSDLHIQTQGGWKSPEVMRKSYQVAIDEKTRLSNAVFENFVNDAIKMQ